MPEVGDHPQVRYKFKFSVGYGYGYGWALFYMQGFVLELMTAILPPAGTGNGARIQSELN